MNENSTVTLNIVLDVTNIEIINQFNLKDLNTLRKVNKNYNKIAIKKINEIFNYFKSNIQIYKTSYCEETLNKEHIKNILDGEIDSLHSINSYSKERLDFLLNIYSDLQIRLLERIEENNLNILETILKENIGLNPHNLYQATFITQWLINVHVSFYGILDGMLCSTNSLRWKDSNDFCKKNAKNILSGGSLNQAFEAISIQGIAWENAYNFIYEHAEFHAHLAARNASSKKFLDVLHREFTDSFFGPSISLKDILSTHKISDPHILMIICSVYSELLVMNWLSKEESATFFKKSLLNTYRTLNSNQTITMDQTDQLFLSSINEDRFHFNPWIIGIKRFMKKSKIMFNKQLIQQN